MPMITWKRIVAAALAALAAATAAFGLATGSTLWIASGALLGGFILAGLVVGIYRRVGYQIMVSGRHDTYLEQMRDTVASIAQSNVEIRRTVREIAAWDLRPIVLDAFRELVDRIERMEQRMDLADEQLRATGSGIGRVSEHAERISDSVDGIRGKLLELLDSLAEVVEGQRPLARLEKTLTGLNDAAGTHADALDRTDKRMGKVEQALDESLAAARQQAQDLEQGAFTPIKRLERELGNDALRFSLVNDIAALTLLHDQVPARATGPVFSGWALEPVPAVRLVETILRERPSLVVECGSGASTVLLAYALEKIGGRLVALEHLDKYAAMTRYDLRRHGLEHVAEVRLAPIEPCSINGQAHDWYAKSAWADLQDIGLFLIDGPPKAIGNQARYPAMPLLAKALSKDALVVLDDTHRTEEKGILDRWNNELAGVGEIFNLGPSTTAFRWTGK